MEFWALLLDCWCVVSVGSDGRRGQTGAVHRPVHTTHGFRQAEHTDPDSARLGRRSNPPPSSWQTNRSPQRTCGAEQPDTCRREAGGSCVKAGWCLCAGLHFQNGSSQHHQNPLAMDSLSASEAKAQCTASTSTRLQGTDKHTSGTSSSSPFSQQCLSPAVRLRRSPQWFLVPPTCNTGQRMAYTVVEVVDSDHPWFTMICKKMSRSQRHLPNHLIKPPAYLLKH